MAARELCRLEGFHGEYSLRQWAMECELPKTTLRNQYVKLSDEEKDVLRAIGDLEAKEQVKKQKSEVLNLKHSLLLLAENNAW